jgi:predicted nucleic acid binding AN1-type Zn finger protein
MRPNGLAIAAGILIAIYVFSGGPMKTYESFRARFGKTANEQAFEAVQAELVKYESAKPKCDSGSEYHCAEARSARAAANAKLGSYRSTLDPTTYNYLAARAAK